MNDARYFYGTGHSLDENGELVFPIWARIPVDGEFFGAVFGNLDDHGGGQLEVVVGQTTLTAPDGSQQTIIAALGETQQLEHKDPDRWHFTDLDLTMLLLQDGTLVFLQRNADTQPDVLAGDMPVDFWDTLAAHHVILSDSGNFIFPEGQYDGSFGGGSGMVDPICFSADALIATMRGPRAAGDIRPGDLVLTRDRGYRPVRWVGRQRLSGLRLLGTDRLRPIRIAAGALGQGVPARDLTVSPQHRMLLAGPTVASRLGTEEVLAAAKHLVGLPGIGIECPAEGVTYVHLLLDTHEVLLAEGAWAESLYTGKQAMKALPAAQRAEILTLFPDLATGFPAHAAPARRFLTGREVRAWRKNLAPGAIPA